MLRLVKQLALVLMSGILLASLSFGQDTNGQNANGQETTGAAPAATGLDTTTQLSENPPLSGLDQPSFEPGYGARSYLAPRLIASEGADSNVYGNVSQGGAISSETRLLGILELQKLWKIHPLDVDYIGGVDWYNGNAYQVHSLAATQRILWRTGQLAIRDSFSYLPEGTFGFGAYGGYGGLNSGTGGGGLGGAGLGGGLGGAGLGGGIAGGGGTGNFSNGQFGAIGNQARISNMAVVDLTQYLSPRSSVVLAGAFAVTNFLNNPLGYVNSQGTIIQAGYNHIISRKDQVALTYAFEELHFPSVSAGSANINVWQVMYGRRISGRLDLRLSVGPQWVHLHEEVPFLIFVIPLNQSFLSASGRAALTYHLSSRSNLHFDYMHYVSTGSGFFAGAKTDTFTFAAMHSFSRRWSMTGQLGYSHNSRLLPTATPVINNASTYSYWFLGLSVRRELNPQFGLFANYEYNSFTAGQGFCGASNPGCNRGYGRHLGSVGLSWTPHPIRLD